MRQNEYLWSKGLITTKHPINLQDNFGQEIWNHKIIYNFRVSLVQNFSVKRTAAMAEWKERPPHEWEVVGSIPGRGRLKSLELIVVASPLRIMGIALRLARQCQDINGLVTYWLKIVQETWICELPPLDN